MDLDKLLKISNLDLQILSDKAKKIETLAHTLNKAIQGEQLDAEHITDVINIMAGFAIDIVNNVNEIEVGE